MRVTGEEVRRMTEGTEMLFDSPQELTLSDVLRVVGENVGDDFSVPDRVEIQCVGSDDVMVRIYPGGGQEAEGFAFKMPIQF